MKRAAIEAGGVYVDSIASGNFRRVVAIHDLHLVYSDGGDRNSVVLIKTFQRWARVRVRQRGDEDVIEPWGIDDDEGIRDDEGQGVRA